MKRFNLIDFRKRSGLTQMQMAEKLGISKSHYTALELGRQNPSYSLMEKFYIEFSEQISCSKDNRGLWSLFEKEVSM